MSVAPPAGEVKSRKLQRRMEEFLERSEPGGRYNVAQDEAGGGILG